MYLNRHTSSGQSRVYRVTQLRTDGIHCRESAGTGPVVLKIVPVTGAALFASPCVENERTDTGRDGGARLARPHYQAQTETAGKKHFQDWQPYPVDSMLS